MLNAKLNMNISLAAKLALASLLCAAAPAFASPWTTVATAGTVDESDLAEVAMSMSSVTFSSSAPAIATITLRYNVTAAPDLDNGGVNKTMAVRFFDNGADATVTVTLKKYSYTTGATTNVLTLNSNNYSQGSSNQLQTVGDGCWAESFNFQQNAYYIEVVISRSSAAGSAGVSSIQVSDLDIC